VLCCSICCESRCAILCQWLQIMVCYSEPLNHDELFCASCCEFTMCYAVPFVVSHCRQCCTSGGESWCAMLCQWTNFCNYWLSIAHHDKQPLANHITLWFTTAGTAEPTMIHNHWHSIAHHDVVNHGVLCCASGSKSWCWILSQWL
jgi:hypothetical protein